MIMNQLIFQEQKLLVNCKLLSYSNTGFCVLIFCCIIHLLIFINDISLWFSFLHGLCVVYRFVSHFKKGIWNFSSLFSTLE